MAKPRKHREREDTFDVPEGFALPSLQDLLGDGGRLEPGSTTLTSRYVDTAGQDLWRAGVTLRRRTGDTENGWQLKLPAGDARTELTSDAKGREVPASLRKVVLGLTGGRALEPVAELVTERQTFRLLDAAAALRAEIAVDRVRSTAYGSHEVGLDAWNEVEVELGPAGDEDLLAAVGVRLAAAGAEPSRYPVKLGRALALPPRAEPPAADPVTLGDLLSGYIREQGAEIVAGDLAVRLGEPTVHRTRVAIRRLRSTLRVFADVFEPAAAARLDEELRWFAGLMGEVRDREVLLERVGEQVRALPAELVLGPVLTELEEVLSGERRHHLRRLEEEMATPRHLDLLGALARWVTEPPFTEAAEQPAADVEGYSRRAWHKARQRLTRGLKHPEGAAQEELLHSARKAAKRARYAAEAALPVWPKAESRIARAKALQTELGEHQDIAVAVAFLRRMGAEQGSLRGHNGFTYGLLYGLETARADRLRVELHG